MLPSILSTITRVSMHAKIIKNAIDECNRFSKLANDILESGEVTPADEDVLKRFSLDAMRSLRRVRGESENQEPSETN